MFSFYFFYLFFPHFTSFYTLFMDTIAPAEEIKSHNIHSIAIPALGCGLGGLDWLEVRPRIEKILEQFSRLTAVVFEPDHALCNLSEKYQDIEVGGSG